LSWSPRKAAVHFPEELANRQPFFAASHAATMEIAKKIFYARSEF
jgi:hypothetical protein